MSFKTGPFLKAACFCESVIEGKDGVFTLVRIVDVITHNAHGTAVPDEMLPFPYQLKMVIMIAPGMAKGRHSLTITPEAPIGLRDEQQVFTVTVHFEEGRSTNLIVDLSYTFEQEGTYLFHVSLDEEHLTSMPLTVRYNRTIMSG